MKQHLSIPGVHRVRVEQSGESFGRVCAAADCDKYIPDWMDLRTRFCCRQCSMRERRHVIGQNVARMGKRIYGRKDRF